MFYITDLERGSPSLYYASLGEVSEWLKEPVSKTGKVLRPSRVRIPPSPFPSNDLGRCMRPSEPMFSVLGVIKNQERPALHGALWELFRLPLDKGVPVVRAQVEDTSRRFLGKATSSSSNSAPG